MMSDHELSVIQEFAHPDFCSSIRALLVNDEPHFVANDIGAAIKLSNVRQSTANLADDEKGAYLVLTPGGVQRMTTVTESGLYTLVLRCDDAIKPGTDAYKFRRWVTSEVLPALRKNGSYPTPKAKAAAAAAPKPLRITGALLRETRTSLQWVFEQCPRLSGGVKQTIIAEAMPYLKLPPATLFGRTWNCGELAKELGWTTAKLSRHDDYKKLMVDPNGEWQRFADPAGGQHEHWKWFDAGRDAVLAACRPVGTVVPFERGDGEHVA